MSYDICGGILERGHCEVHPDVPETYPCSQCLYDKRGPENSGEPGPCEGCWYVTGDMRECDGSCEGMPSADWSYFKAHPEQLAGAIASETHRRTYYTDGVPRDQPRHSNGQFAPKLRTDPGTSVLV